MAPLALGPLDACIAHLDPKDPWIRWEPPAPPLELLGSWAPGLSSPRAQESKGARAHRGSDPPRDRGLKEQKLELRTPGPVDSEGIRSKCPSVQVSKCPSVQVYKCPGVHGIHGVHGCIGPRVQEAKRAGAKGPRDQRSNCSKDPRNYSRERTKTRSFLLLPFRPKLVKFGGCRPCPATLF